MSQKLMRIRSVIRCAWLVLLVGAAASCGDVVRSGRSPVMLVVNSLNVPATTSGTFLAHVGTGAPEIAEATLAVIMKDITVTLPSTATNNQVTINRYRVAYRRADGRNAQGVDVPFAFDGALTLTVPVNGNGKVDFEIVRQVAKSESPLVQLKQNSVVISTIADVTFFGQDQVGSAISVTGSTLIDFSN